MLLRRHLLDMNQRDAGNDRRTVHWRTIFDGNILAAGIISLLGYAGESGEHMGKARTASHMHQGPVGIEAEARRGGRFGGSGRRLGGGVNRKPKKNTQNERRKTPETRLPFHSGSFAMMMEAIAITRPAVNPYRKMTSID
ncbi:hypothetical protein [Rhizorhapis sp. SPR117]|uniref:hypothetical protein n=1 Tax=Rhizorhapis sp. SPR117 TaxID=2912611 RepID=UPI000B8609FD|nr:hypothetical protein [Rhizorhapis sp. SPR117]